MATAFETILDLKIRKEDSARRELQAWQLKLEQAVRKVEECRRAAEEFSAWILDEQARLYDALEQEESVGRQDVDDVREKISLLRVEEARKYLAIEEAEKEREETAEKTREAEVRQIEAQRKVEKFEELVSIEQTEAAIVAQEAEEREMEDFTTLRDPLA